MTTIEKRVIAMDTSSYDTFNPALSRIKLAKLKKYLNEHPIPNDQVYSQEELIYDLLYSDCPYFLPDEVKKETISYMETLLNELYSTSSTHKGGDTIEG